MRLAQQPEAWERIRVPSINEPLRVLVSACMTGAPVGIDGTHFGMKGAVDPLLQLPTIKTFTFCPEDVGIGTPRTMPDLHGGDGFAVLAGTAKVLDQFGADLTEGMINGAQKMAAYAVEHRIELAILTDMSAACGSQVLSLGCRYDADRHYQAGVGVATAALLNAGIIVVSQRDYASLERLMIHCGAEIELRENARDHHQTDWYTDYFSKDRR